MKLVVCLWREPDRPPRYGLKHVERMEANLARRAPGVELQVLVDEHFASEVVGLPFKHDFPGYLRLLEVFRPDQALEDGEIRVLTGLDTVFVNDSRWLWRGVESPYFALPRWPWLRKPTDAWFSNALVAYDEKGRQAMWEATRKLTRLRGHSGSEMDLMRKVHGELGSKVLGSPETIVSYPMQGVEACKSASVVYFHLEPKQDTLPEDDPVRREWERA